MNFESLLRSVRTPVLLIQKPDADSPIYWDLPITGLHTGHLKSAVSELRKSRQKVGEKVSHPSLKIKDLLDNAAISLGGESYEHWLHHVEPELAQFMQTHSLRQPSDLITWKSSPFRGSLTPRQIADRLFFSGRSLPKRLFTGVDNLMFAASGYGFYDLNEVASRLTNDRNFVFRSQLEQIGFAFAYRDQIVLRAQRLEYWSPDAPDYLDLTAQRLVLNAFDMDVSCACNLLGDSLVDPMLESAEFQFYNANDVELKAMHQLFTIFREEIERSEDGWVEVIPFNSNVIFLRGLDGRFDWIVRDQRNEPFSANDLYPIFRAAEVPRALENKALQTYLHYKKGLWLDRIKHNAEQQHYRTGGTVANYPGEDAIVERYLVSMEGFKPPKQISSFQHVDFKAHVLPDKHLMVSDLITINEFWQFYERGWQERRTEKSALANRPWISLPEMNCHDPVHLPVCVTWFDAIAYCKFIEERTGLPVRLLTIEEWRAISPSRNAVEALGQKANAHCIEALNEEGVIVPPPTYLPYYITRFKSDLCWIQNDQGLEFLSSLTFGEWLGNYRGSAPNHVHAPVACTASGIALGRGPLERDLFEGAYVGKNNHLKVGFRVCYVADLSS